MFWSDTKPKICATPQKSVDFISQPFLPTRGHLIVPQLTRAHGGTRLSHLVTCAVGSQPRRPGRLTHFKEREKSFLLVSLFRTR